MAEPKEFEADKVSLDGQSAPSKKLDLASVDKVEREKEPLSLLAISPIDVTKAINAAKIAPPKEIAESNMVSPLRAADLERPSRLAIQSSESTLKNYYEDGILKVYTADDAKSHVGFKFLQVGDPKDKQTAIVQKKEKLEDMFSISLQYRIKF